MIVVATGDAVYAFEGSAGSQAQGMDGARPSCLSATSVPGGPIWCGTQDRGVFQSTDGGHSWAASGLEGHRITAVASSPSDPDLVWAGTEPSAIWRSSDSGGSWTRREGLSDLPSSPEWSFPPRPDTHHVRWIACHPTDPARLWVAIEAGALISTRDGGLTWQDRVQGGPYDTHELAVDPRDPDHLHVSAGDGFYESPDGGHTWSSFGHGLDVGYLRSVAVDPLSPSVVVVSAASSAREAYMAGRSDGRLYRREGSGAWTRIRHGWPEPPATLAPLLVADARGEGLVAADERGVHRSTDSGNRWRRLAEYPAPVSHLRGLATT